MRARTDEQEERDEAKWTEGEQAAYRAMLGVVLDGLRSTGTTDDPSVRIAQLELYQSEIIAALRAACDEFGDNDWPDDLHVADVIEKHLLRHVRASTEELNR